MTVTDPFAAPTDKAQEPTSTGGNFVPLSAMVGRLILILPLELDRKVLSNFKAKDGSDQYSPRLTADIAVLSGDTQFDWVQDEKDQDFEADQIPWVFEGVWIQSAPLVDKTEDARRVDLTATLTLGRLTKPKAYGLKAASDKDVTTARTWLGTTGGKAFATKAQAAHDARVAESKGETPAGAEASPFG